MSDYRTAAANLLPLCGFEALVRHAKFISERWHLNRGPDPKAKRDITPLSAQCLNCALPQNMTSVECLWHLAKNRGNPVTESYHYHGTKALFPLTQNCSRSDLIGFGQICWCQCELAQLHSNWSFCIRLLLHVYFSGKWLNPKKTQLTLT